MQNRLQFNLVAPEAELFRGEVDSVIVPGEEGDFGVLPGHAPVMALLRSGTVTMLDGAQRDRIFVRGGFADVSTTGLTILAVEAIRLSQVNGDALASELRGLQEQLQGLSDTDNRKQVEVRIGHIEALQRALAEA